MITQMEILMPSLEYEYLVLSLEPKTSNEEEDKRDTNGARPSGTKIVEQSRDLKGGKDSLEREVVEQILQQVEFVLHEVSFQEYALQPQKQGNRYNLMNI